MAGMGRLVGTMVGAFGGRALGGMIGGNTGRMIGSIAGSMIGSRGIGNAGSLLGGLLGGDEAEAQAAAAQLDDDDATLLVRAMCNAAKADLEVDRDELDNIMGQMGDLSGEERAFLEAELQAPLDADGFINSVPLRLANDVYTVSLLTIKVDTPAELAYMQRLADGLGIDPETRSAIHESLGIDNIDG